MHIPVLISDVKVYIYSISHRSRENAANVLEHEQQQQQQPTSADLLP